MAEDGTLRVALVDGEIYSPLYDRLEEFTRSTGIEIETRIRLPLPELAAHLRAALPGGAGYDLVCAHSRYTADLAPYLAPLELDAGEIAAFDGFALDLCRRQGRLLQLPRSIETRLLFFRSDVFEDRRERAWFAEASEGRELRVPRTWEELAAVAQYFTRAGKMHGFLFPGRGEGLLATFAEILTSVGGTFFDGGPRFYSRAGEWSLQLLRDLVLRWEAVPEETPDCGFEEVSEMFRMGRCALACDFPGTARLLCDPTFSAVAGWHSVALYPTGTGGRRSVWTGSPTFAIPADCADPPAAMRLILFLAGRESQLLEAGHGAIPSRLDTRDEARERLREGTLGHLRFTLAEQTLRLAPLTPPSVPGYAAMEERVWPVLRQAITGEREVAEALELAYRAAEEALE